VSELSDDVWCRTPGFRRTVSYGRRMIAMSRSDGRFGENATEWVDVDTMSDESLKEILAAYGGAT